MLALNSREILSKEVGVFSLAGFHLNGWGCGWKEEGREIGNKKPVLVGEACVFERCGIMAVL